MIRIRSKNVLLVAPNVVSFKLLPKNKLFRHVSSTANIFPAIHEIKPNLVIFDYEYLSKDMEKILRRLSCNSSYSNIKICCYKPKAQTKIDELLKTLGVDHIFYEEDLQEEAPGKSFFNSFNKVFDMPVINWLAKPAH